MVSFIVQLNIGYAYFEGFTDSTKKQGNTINKTIFGPREVIYSWSKVFLYHLEEIQSSVSARPSYDYWHFSQNSKHSKLQNIIVLTLVCLKNKIECNKNCD